MKLKNMTDVEAFRSVIHDCVGDIFLKSAQGDVYNLKSSMSEYLALGRLLGEQGNCLELFASERADEKRLADFLESVSASE